MHMQSKTPVISIIVAIAKNHAIGKNNQLLWHISNDLKRFKNITKGHTVIMGKRTFESLPNGPLPKRRNIVLSDKPNDYIEGCEIANSIGHALEMSHNETEVFIIGGGSVYSQFMPLANRLYLTIVDKDFDADTFFPAIDFSSWKLVEKIIIDNDPQNDFTYRFETYERH
jgi:dihydrofolate reductase